MLRPNRILNIFTAITIVLASLLQFHHHDCNGNISIHLTTIDDITLGTLFSYSEECSHTNRHTHQTDCNSVEDCAMHIAISKTIKQNKHTQIAQGPSFDLYYLLAIQIECQPIINEAHTSFHSLILALLSPLLFPLKSLRAPPPL